MLCKYYLQLGCYAIDTENPDCMDVSSMIKNLDSIKVSYARVDLGGVVRKCGSSLEFTGKAYDAIIAHYEENYLQSKGVFAVYMADNNWNYSKVWECPLDFATLQYDANVVTIGCVDNSAAAIIKANKKSKYEFGVTELKDASNLMYNGVLDKLEYPFSIASPLVRSGNNYDWDNSAKMYFLSMSYCMFFPSFSIAPNENSSIKLEVRNQEGRGARYGFVLGMDMGACIQAAVSNPQPAEQTEKRCWFVRAKKSCTMHLSLDFTYSWVIRRWNGEEMPDLHKHAANYQTSLCLVIGNRIVWSRQINPTSGDNIVIDSDFFMNADEKMSFVVVVNCNRTDDLYNEEISVVNMLVTSDENIVTVRESPHEENPLYISVIKPITLVQKLAEKMFSGTERKVLCSIEYGDSIVSKALLVASEAIRGINNSKIYSSFTDFCNFMEVVFGYVYTVNEVGYYMLNELAQIDKGERETLTHIMMSAITSEPTDNTGTGYARMLPIDEIVTEDPGDNLDLTTPHDYRTSYPNIVYIEPANVFAVPAAGGKYYANFTSIDLVAQGDWYNDETGHAREMTGLAIGSLSTGGNLAGNDDGYMFGIIRNGRLILCDATHSKAWLDSEENNKHVTEISFVHRTSVFGLDVVKTLLNVNNLSFQLDESKVYSDLEIGYSKKDYEKENAARYEFNFTNYYKTNCDLTDDTLSMICPYRADCYGMEELLTKNNEEESTESDSDIFIVIASDRIPETDGWKLGRDRDVQNVSDSYSVFNADIAPSMIVKNNEEYLGSCVETLKFTSSDGNSSATIDGVSVSGDINITKQLFKVGKISIDTDDHCFPETWDGLIEFEYAGKTYMGYLDSIDICFANLGTITYNIIEKCIE